MLVPTFKTMVVSLVDGVHNFVENETETDFVQTDAPYLCTCKGIISLISNEIPLLSSPLISAMAASTKSIHDSSFVVDYRNM